MGKIMKFCFMGAVIYFGLNWAADNPLKVKILRKEMNKQVAEGRQAVEETTSSLATELKK